MPASQHNAYASYRFYVQIGSAPQAVFTAATGLQVELEVTDYQEGGNNNYVHRFPGRTKAGSVTLKRGMTQSDEFLTWMLDTAKGTIARQNVTIVMYKANGDPVRRWTLGDAFPMKWVGPMLDAGSKEVAIETLELAFSSLTVS
jgi:phage tail-like protein